MEDATIREGEFTRTHFFILSKVTFIYSLRCFQNPFSLPFISKKESPINFFVWKLLKAFSMHESLRKTTNIFTSIRPFKSAITLLDAIDKFTNIKAPVFVLLFSSSMRLVIDPISSKDHLPILVDQLSMTVSTRVFNSAPIVGSIRINEDAINTICYSVFKVALKIASIKVICLSRAMRKSSLPMPIIDHTLVFQFQGGSLVPINI